MIQYLNEHEVIFTILLSFVAVGVSVVAIVISLRLGKNQLKVALFEKRYELYWFIEEFMDIWDFSLRNTLENDASFMFLFLSHYGDSEVVKSIEPPIDHYFWLEEIGKNYNKDLDKFKKISLIFDIDEKNIEMLSDSYIQFWTGCQNLALTQNTWLSTNTLQSHKDNFQAELNKFDKTAKRMKEQVTLKGIR